MSDHFHPPPQPSPARGEGAGSDVALFAQAACLLEATARKPGNVHRLADFADCGFLDFALSAAAIGPCFAPGRAVGDMVLSAVVATRRVTRANTNLGIALLLAPLAAGPLDQLPHTLRSLTVEDARQVFRAIRLANPGGLGDAPEQDVAHEPTLPLRDIMALAADRDGIARQYAHDFSDVFEIGLPALLAPADHLEAAIIHCHLTLLAVRPDSLIARKRGPAVAAEATHRAAAVLAGAPAADFDAWLRADGHARNPGTTADLVAACLFVALRSFKITLPITPPWPSLP